MLYEGGCWVAERGHMGWRAWGSLWSQAALLPSMAGLLSTVLQE
jgi:hypothetical protein